MIADERLSRTDGSYRRDCREELIAVKVEDVAMNVVGSALEYHVGVGAGIAALVGFTAGLHGELVDGLDRDEAAGDGGDAALVGGYDAEPWIDIVGSVYLEIDACGSVAVDGVGDRTAARGEPDNLRDVTSC